MCSARLEGKGRDVELGSMRGLHLGVVGKTDNDFVGDSGGIETGAIELNVMTSAAGV